MNGRIVMAAFGAGIVATIFVHLYDLVLHPMVSGVVNGLIPANTTTTTGGAS